MPLTNVVRAFGSDTLFLLALSAPVVAVYVIGRSRSLRSSRAHPLVAALLEAAAFGYAVCIAAVTLIPSGMPDQFPHHVDWRPFSSDLAYAPERTQVIGNLVLFAPLVGLLIVATRPRRPLLFGIGLSVVLPAIVELLQYLAVSGRATTVEDWVLGTVGGLAATVAVATLRTLRSTPRARSAIADPSP